MDCQCWRHWLASWSQLRHFVFQKILDCVCLLWWRTLLYELGSNAVEGIARIYQFFWRLTWGNILQWLLSWYHKLKLFRAHIWMYLRVIQIYSIECLSRKYWELYFLIYFKKCTIQYYHLQKILSLWKQRTLPVPMPLLVIVLEIVNCEGIQSWLWLCRCCLFCRSGDLLNVF